MENRLLGVAEMFRAEILDPSTGHYDLMALAGDAGIQLSVMESLQVLRKVRYESYGIVPSSYADVVPLEDTATVTDCVAYCEPVTEVAVSEELIDELIAIDAVDTSAEEAEFIPLPGSYYFDATKQAYVMPLDGQLYLVAKALHEELLDRYSNFDGNPATVNDLCDEYDLSERVIRSYIKIAGIIHDDLPFTKEDKTSLPADALSAELVRKKDAAIRKAARLTEQKKLRQTVAMEGAALEMLLDAVTKTLPLCHVTKMPAMHARIADEPYAAVIGLTDVHFGKYADPKECGKAYNKKICKELVFSHLTQVLARMVACFGRPQKIYLLVGSDFFHIDNIYGTTTKGTRQDIDGTPQSIAIEGPLFMCDIVEMVKSCAPVDLVYAPGNHDQFLSGTLLGNLGGRFGSDPEVDVHIDLQAHRSYRTYGKNLIGFTHGDGVSIKKPDDLANLMSEEASNDWGPCNHKTWYLGHLHHEKTITNSHRSVTIHQIPSITPADSWHAKQGYTPEQQKLPVYIHSKERGHIATLYSSI